MKRLYLKKRLCVASFFKRRSCEASIFEDAFF